MYSLLFAELPEVGSFQYLFYGTLTLLGVAGVQNIIARVLLLYLFKKTHEWMKSRKIIRSIISMLVCLFLCFSLFTREGSIRLLCASYGHPVIAYTFSSDIIQIRSHQQSYLFSVESIYVKTGKLDFEAMPIMPMIEVYHIGPFYYSRIWRNTA